MTVLQATDGSASASLEGEPEAIRRTIRLEEARQVAETAGFRPTIFWKEDNAAFAARPELVTRLRDLLTAIRPALVFTPFLTDLHPDHQTLNRILAAAIAEPMDDALRIMGYEVWGSAVVSTYCDVARSMPLLERLLGIYDTAMMADDFVSMLWTRNYYHSLVLRGCPGFVEAFFKCDPRRFRELVLSDEGIRVHATT